MKSFKWTGAWFFCFLVLAAFALLPAESVHAETTWFCPNCGKEVKTKFCTTCGMMQPASWVCVCGAENTENYCGNCGRPRAEGEQRPYFEPTARPPVMPTATPTPVPREAITGFKVTGKTRRAVSLTWKQYAYAQVYRVYYKKNGADKWLRAGETAAAKYTVTNLASGQTYAFKVYALDETGAVRAVSSALTGIKTNTIKKGGVYRFGHYEQDGNTANGKEAIEWKVLDIKGNKALLVSRYVLDCQKYNSTVKNVTWEKSTLRTWLNGTFLKAAFTSAEKGAILTTAVSNTAAQGNKAWQTKSGNNTKDRVFLLSVAEANQYFKTEKAKRCTPTIYAVNKKAWPHDGGYCYWWYRSPGPSQSSAAICLDNGKISSRRVAGELSQISGYFSDIGVRPAMWVSLNSNAF